MPIPFPFAVPAKERSEGHDRSSTQSGEILVGSVAETVLPWKCGVDVVVNPVP